MDNGEAGACKTVSVDVFLTPKDVAEHIWCMDSEEQAEMLHHLYCAAGSTYLLMMQFLDVRRQCEERNDESLDAFQALFSSAYKYMGT